MSASPADVERKIRQLDNEVQAIYEMLARIEGTQRRHDNRFAEIGTDLTDLRGQVADLRADVSGLDTKVTSLDTKVTSLDGKVTALDAKLDRVIGLLER
jgi:chromosome segregation ATPase